MALPDERILVKAPHNLIIESRKDISITGVSEIDSFDENAVIAMTSYGELSIIGDNLHVNKLNIDSGELSISGNIRAISYSENTASPKSFLAKIFK